MTPKDWIKLFIGWSFAALTAGVIIWAMLALYRPTFEAVNDASENGRSKPLLTE